MCPEEIYRLILLIPASNIIWSLGLNIWNHKDKCALCSNVTILLWTNNVSIFGDGRIDNVKKSILLRITVRRGFKNKFRSSTKVRVPWLRYSYKFYRPAY